MNPHYKNPGITRDDLVRLYATEGMPQDEIGRRYGVSRKTIAYYLRKWQISRRTQSESGRLRWQKETAASVDLEHLQEALRSGKTAINIAREQGCSRRTVSRLIRSDADLERMRNRNRSEHQRQLMQNKNPVPRGSKRTVTWREDIDRRSREFMVRLLEMPISRMGFKRYAKVARYVAYRHYRFGRSIPEGLVIDHIFSIADGFAHGVPIPVISHPTNLRLVSREENGRKGARSLVTIEEFLRIVGWTQTGPGRRCAVRATINGQRVEGTPEEIARLMELAKSQGSEQQTRSPRWVDRTGEHEADDRSGQ